MALPKQTSEPINTIQTLKPPKRSPPHTHTQKQDKPQPKHHAEGYVVWKGNINPMAKPMRQAGKQDFWVHGCPLLPKHYPCMPRASMNLFNPRFGWTGLATGVGSSLQNPQDVLHLFHPSSLSSCQVFPPVLGFFCERSCQLRLSLRFIMSWFCLMLPAKVIWGWPA